MRHRLVRFLTLFACALPFAGAAADLPREVQTALRQAGIPADHVAVWVQELGARRPLIAHRADRAMHPASVMKLVTTWAALGLLGPAYHWPTEYYALGEVEDGVLDGDLYVKGYGDPKLTLEDLWLQLRQLRQAGLKDVRGDLVLDRSRFYPPAAHSGDFDGMAYSPYNTLPDALLVNFNTLTLTARPTPDGRTVDLSADPASPAFVFVNRLRAVARGPCAGWEDRLTLGVAARADGARVTVSGDYPAACGEQSAALNVIAPDAYVSGVFRGLWEELGGSFRGRGRAGTVPAGARRIAQFESEPLALAVRDVNKFSNNVMARQIFLTLGTLTSGARTPEARIPGIAMANAGVPGTPARAFRAVNDWLAARGLRFPELVMENGSGLSRTERISAAHLGALLLDAWRSPLHAEFESSLPLAAVDGTLRRRLRDTPAAGRAHLKTGSVEGVRAIAGYLNDAGERRWAVVFLINHANAARGGAAQDALLGWLAARD